MSDTQSQSASMHRLAAGIEKIYIMINSSFKAHLHVIVAELESLCRIRIPAHFIVEAGRRASIRPRLTHAELCRLTSHLVAVPSNACRFILAAGEAHSRDDKRVRSCLLMLRIPTLTGRHWPLDRISLQRIRCIELPHLLYRSCLAVFRRPVSADNFPLRKVEQCPRLENVWCASTGLVVEGSDAAMTVASILVSAVRWRQWWRRKTARETQSLSSCRHSSG